MVDEVNEEEDDEEEDVVAEVVAEVVGEKRREATLLEILFEIEILLEEFKLFEETVDLAAEGMVPVSFVRPSLFLLSSSSSITQSFSSINTYIIKMKKRQYKKGILIQQKILT